MVYLKTVRMIHIALFYFWRLNCLSGFDLERGKVSRRSDSRNQCYFYNPSERKWLEGAWFGKYGVSWHISVLLRKSDSRLQWQGCIHVIQSCIVRMCFVYSRRQGLVPILNTKAYFLRNNAGSYQLCNNPRFPLRSRYMRVKVMRIDSVAHRLLRELIADCLGHTFKTHVRSFMNKGHVVKNATKLLGLSFYLKIKAW